MKSILVPGLFTTVKATFFAHSLIRDIFFKKSYLKGENSLSERKFNEAAEHFSDWLEDKEVAEALRQKGPEQVLKDRLEQPLMAFFASTQTDMASRHLMQITPKDLGCIVSHPSRKSTVLHIAAGFGRSEFSSIYKKMMFNLNSHSQTGLLLAINGLGDTPIDLAQRNNNSEFIKCSRSICDLPSSEDIEYKSKGYQ